jgi:hypothetical protein
LNRGKYIFYSRVDEFGRKRYDCDQRVDTRVLTAVIKQLQIIESLQKKPSSKAKWELHERAIEKAHASLNRILVRYVATPTIQTHSVFDIEWTHGSQSPKFAELRSILEIIEIAREHRISDLKHCPQCSKWFIGFSYDEFCGDECKKSSTPQIWPAIATERMSKKEAHKTRQ